MSQLWADKMRAQARERKRKEREHKAKIRRRKVNAVRHPLKTAKKRWLW